MTSLLCAVTTSSLRGSYWPAAQNPSLTALPTEGLRPGLLSDVGRLPQLPSLPAPHLHHHKPSLGAQESGRLCSQDTRWFPGPVSAPFDELDSIFSQDGAGRAKKSPAYLFLLHKVLPRKNPLVLNLKNRVLEPESLWAG